jgi:uroporphyrinogen decarboxylase
MKRMMELVHQTGAYVFFHSDGAIRKIIPDMIEAGIDVLNPIQWNCTGMEREALVRDFGDKVVFHGGVDNQYTLAFGSPEEVRKQVLEQCETFSPNGGFVFNTVHNIQANTPLENMVAMIDAVNEFNEK